MSFLHLSRVAATGLLAALAIVTAACGGRGGAGQVITVDGSSTVYPVTEAVAEEFQRANPGMRVTVGLSGTGGGFSKFCRNETDISNASRPISPEEVAECRNAGIEYIEVPVAYDGLAVVVNPQNTWATSMTVAELKKLWEPDAQGRIMRWSQIRDGWPDREIRLFGAGTDSGTFDYFTEAIVGKTQASRGDFTSSEDDNVLVQGVDGDPLALGFFGFAYYEENRDKLKLVAIDDEDPTNGDGPIAPSPETVGNGTYRPLSRPIFIYAKTSALERPEVRQFVEFYIDHATELTREVGYIPLTSAEYQLVRRRFETRTPGSMYEGVDSHSEVTLEERLRR